MYAVSTFTRLAGSISRHCGNLFKACQNVPSMQLSSLAAAPVKPSFLGAQSTTIQPVRNRTIYNHAGNPETVQDVVDRFFRLYNGLWIRPRTGRHKKRWAKKPRRVHRLSQHVFCTKRQCWTLDKMVNLEYKVPHYYVDDPYEVYHRKSNLPDRRFEPPKFFP